MKYSIEIKNVFKKFGHEIVLNKVNLSIPEGKIYGFLGKNGAGKTTLLKIITGIITDYQGEIFISGYNIRSEKSLSKREIGCIIEYPSFYENLTAIDNLKITCMHFNVDYKRINEVLKICRLNNSENKKVNNFSLGMKQRLGIAASLLHNPKILILDEPTNGLDPLGIKELRDFIIKLSQENKITIFISSHIISEIEQISDYISVIENGVIIETIDMKKFDSKKQEYLNIQTNDLIALEKIIINMNLSYKISDDIVRVYCEKDKNPFICEQIIENNLKIYDFSSNSFSLENKFFNK